MKIYEWNGEDTYSSDERYNVVKVWNLSLI